MRPARLALCSAAALFILGLSCFGVEFGREASGALAQEEPTATASATPTDTVSPTGTPGEITATPTLTPTEPPTETPTTPPDWTATPTITPTPTPAESPTETPTESPTPTPTGEPTPTATPETTPVLVPVAYLPCLLRGWPEPTATPTDTPTPTPTIITYYYLPMVLQGWPPPTPTPTFTATPSPTPTFTPTATPTPMGDPGFAYGIQAHMASNDRERVASAVNDLGLSWVKQQVEWRLVEPAKGSYDWATLDAVVNTANSHGIRVLLSVLRPPPWAANSPFGPPRSMSDLGDFMAAVSARYAGRGMAYEIWNEQNLQREWDGYPIGSKDNWVGSCKYVDMLRATYPRIKAADPYAIVVSGGLTPNGLTGGEALDDREYLRQMYNCGAGGSFDALGAHPSGFNNPPDVGYGWTDGATGYKNHPSFFFYNTMVDYRAIMVDRGDSAKDIWITEFGWAVQTPPYPVPGGYGYALDNTEDERAAWIVKAYQMCKAWGFVGVATLWNLDFRIVAPGSEQALFGILDAGWIPTKSYNALKSMAK